MLVNETISSTDTMMEKSVVGYLRQGAEALAAIEGALDRTEPRSILDLPCGHGRVARHLAARYPNAELFVSDLDEAGMRFCAATFGATPLPSRPSFDDLDFGRSFDLIFAGSLITHLSTDRTESFLGFVRRHLSPSGVAVVTSHGELVAGRCMLANSLDRPIYGLTLQHQAEALIDYFATGYGYRHYPNATAYGISLISRDWLSAAAERQSLRVQAYHGHAWDNHQDVVVLRAH